MRIETPRGAVFHQTTKNGKVKAVLEWNPDFVPHWDGAYNEVQVFVDNEVLRLSDPYTPMQSGMLKLSGKLGTVPGSGEVIYNAPYARYHYYGKVMEGRAPKKLTDRDIQHHGVPPAGQRGPYWFERMKADKKDQILRGAAKIMKEESR